jgi:outer membrane protein assembly factor BamA
LIVREIIKNPPGKSGHELFILDSIVFVGEASISENFPRTIDHYKDVTFSFARSKYSKKILEWRIPLRLNEPYSKELSIETQRQLLFLDNFKFVNINYDTTGNRFIANIFTSPFKKYQTTSEFGFTSTGQGIPGPFLNASVKNRNTFRGFEVVSINANLELQDLLSVTGEQNNERRYSSRQFGGEVSIAFPQFLVPKLSYYKKKMGLFNPKTRLSFGVNFEDRVNEYTRTNYQGTYQYSWQIKDKVKYTLTPFQLNLVNSQNDSTFQQTLDSLTEQGNTFALSFRSALVNSTSFQLDRTLGNYASGKDGGFISFFIESGGHFNDLFRGRTEKDSLETYNFLKSSIDLRKIERVTRRMNIAYRLHIGFAYAYADNNSLPYEKYFFTGGSNSIRAWRQRRLGPGAFGVYSNDDLTTRTDDPETSGYNPVLYTREQPGEFLIESSFEIRQNLVGFLEGAFFIDAGNIWLIRGNTVDPANDPQGDDGKFRINTFIQEVAVGTGLGVRFDLSFLILRLDMGVKILDPAQPLGKRFVGGEIFSNFGPLSELNIGIGYPF